MEDERPRRGRVQAELGDAEAGGERGERRDRRADDPGVGEEGGEPLGDLGEGEVALSVVGDDVDEHRGSPTNSGGDGSRPIVAPARRSAPDPRRDAGRKTIPAPVRSLRLAGFVQCLEHPGRPPRSRPHVPRLWKPLAVGDPLPDRRRM